MAKINFLSYEITEKKIKAICEYNGTLFNVSAMLQAGEVANYRGSVSVNDRTGSTLKIKQKKDGENVEKEIRGTLRIYSNNDAEIKQAITEAIIRLYKKNALAIEKELGLTIRADTITPAVAAHMHAIRYVNTAHATSTEKRQKEIANKIINICAQLENKPMDRFTKREVKTELKKLSIARDMISELRKFWDFCIEKNICDGTNPVEVPARKRKSPAAKRAKANRVNSLTVERQDEIYDYIEQHNNGPNRGIALMLGGGLTADEIEGITWNDLCLEEEDYVKVTLQKNYPGAATHNYTKPLFPQAALIMTHAFNALIKKHGAKAVSRMPVVSFVTNDKRALGKKRINEEAKKLLINKFITHEDYMVVGNSNLDLSAAGVILRNSYENNLRINCNLEEDPGTLAFLLGRSLGNNVTDDRYRSFTTPEASRRIYDILKCLRRNDNVLQAEDIIDEKGNVTKTFAPAKTRGYKRVYVEIQLSPGEQIKISSRHEVKGEMILL